MKGGRLAPFLIAAFVAVFSFSTHAQGQRFCLNHDQVVETLKNDHNEVLHSGGVAGNRGQLMEVYVNSETGAWTMILTTPRNMLSCFVASGEGWQLFKQQKTSF